MNAAGAISFTEEGISRELRLVQLLNAFLPIVSSCEFGAKVKERHEEDRSKAQTLITSTEAGISSDVKRWQLSNELQPIF